MASDRLEQIVYGSYALPATPAAELERDTSVEENALLLSCHALAETIMARRGRTWLSKVEFVLDRANTHISGIYSHPNVAVSRPVAMGVHNDRGQELMGRIILGKSYARDMTRRFSRYNKDTTLQEIAMRFFVCSGNYEHNLRTGQVIPALDDQVQAHVQPEGLRVGNLQALEEITLSLNDMATAL